MDTKKQAIKINKNIKKQPQIKVSIKNSPGIYVYAIICFLFAFAIYSNTFKHSYVLDDNDNFTKNRIIKRGFHAIPTILTTTYRYGVNNLSDNIYRPLSQIMFAVEWQLSPNDPSLSHVINVLFYALSCFLLFIVLRKYMSKAHALIPLAITLLYIAHPIHIEVVSNIKSRDEIMSFFFLMLSLLCLHTWFTKTKWWKWVFLLLSMFMFFLALLSKEGVITILLLFPIIGWYFTDAKPKVIVTGALMLIIPALAYLIIRHQIVSNYSVSSSFIVVDNILVGAHSAGTHFATAIMLLGKYLLLSIIPYKLVSDYGFNQIPLVELGNPLFLISLLVYIAIIVYIVMNFRKKSAIVFGLLFFLITTSIYSNIVFHIGTSFAERLMFLPSLGLCIAFVTLIIHLMKVVSNSTESSVIEILKTKPLFTSIILIILLAFIVKTHARAAEWKDETTLFGNDVKRSPESAHMRLNWGLTLVDNALKKEGNTQDAIMFQAIEQFENGKTIYPKYADCYEQLGLAWYRLKNPDKAMENYNKAVQINPKKAVTWNNIGVIYFEAKDYPKAIEAYGKAAMINHNYFQPHLSIGSIYGILGKYEDAIDELKRCIQIDPENISAHKKIGFCYKGLNKPEEAEQWFEKVRILEQKKN